MDGIALLTESAFVSSLQNLMTAADKFKWSDERTVDTIKGLVTRWKPKTQR
jgi:hypothetical protein